MNDPIDFHARDKARMALENTETLDIQLSLTRSQLAELDRRLTILEVKLKDLEDRNASPSGDRNS